MIDLLSRKNTSPLAVEVIELSHRYNSYFAVDQVSFGIKTGTTLPKILY